MMKKSLALMILLPLLMSGCAPGFLPKHKEISEYDTARVFAVDKGSDGGVKIYIIGNKKGGGEKDSPGGESDAPMYSCEDMTVAAAVNKVALYSDTDIFWGDADIYLLGESLARERDTGEYLDFFMRDYEFRLNSSVYIVEGDMGEFFTSVAEAGYYLPDLVKSVSESSEDHALSYKLKLFELVNMLEDNNSTGAAVPFITMSGQADGDIKKNALININSYGIIRDNRLSYVSNPADSLAFGILTGKGGESIVQVKSGDGGYVALKLTRSRVETEPVFTAGALTGMAVHVRTESDINEIQSEADLFGNHGAIKELEACHSEQIKEMLIDCIARAREKSSDYLGMADALAKKAPRIWREIKSDYAGKFKTLEFTVSVESNINRSYDIRERAGTSGGAK